MRAFQHPSYGLLSFICFPTVSIQSAMGDLRVKMREKGERGEQLKLEQLAISASFITAVVTSESKGNVHTTP